MITKQTSKKTKKQNCKAWFFAFVAITLFMASSSCVEKNQGKSDAPSKFTTRALWVDPPGFVNRESVDIMIEKCQRAGINTILANIMLRENVYFKSTNFEGNVNANNQFDPLAYVIEKAHAANIKVQAWSCAYYAKPKSPDWVSKPFISKNYEHVFLSPGHPEVNPYLISVLKELLDYDIDGLHLDYTRYWNAAFDYSDATTDHFKETYGFNPQDFVDYPERIISPENEDFPIRVFCPNTIVERVWEMGVIERTMNHTELGYAYITEDSQKIDNLKTPGILIVSHYTDVSSDMVDAFERYIKRGGDIIWINPAGGYFEKYPQLVSIAGIKGTEDYKFGHESIKSVDDSKLSKVFSSVNINTGYNSLVVGEAEVLATYSNGEPSITSYREDNGSFMTIGFHLMDSEKLPIIQLLKGVVNWHKTELGLTGPDLMAKKRKQWIEWRTSHTLELMREVNKMVKGKNPNLKVTAAAGVEPQEKGAIYREGAKWLNDGLCDDLFPMNYRDNMEDFREVIENQLSFTPNDKSEKIFPGLQLYKKNDNDLFVPIDASMVKQQLDLIQGYGYQGFCLFAYTYFSDEIIDVVSSYSGDLDE